MADEFKDTTPDEFKMMLIRADLQEEYQTWEGWQRMISGALNLCGQHGFAEAFVQEYEALVDADDRVGLMEKVFADQMDNYILGSLALHILDVPRELPVIAYAAENKRLYEGWHGEIANLRALIIMGFDVDGTALESGNTALHAMCGLRWGKGVHLRGIQALLEGGANPNIQNNGGDSAFTYLCGSHPWTKEVHQAASLLLDHGADAHLAANDGSTGFSLLQANQKNQDQSPARQSLIDELELRKLVARPRAPIRTAPRL